MSYHDSYYHSQLEKKGMAVVNPLHEQQKRLTQLEEFLKEIADEVNDKDLRDKIDKMLEK
jgi:TRAP-type C4-dicarboxylate transport system substrate-binding protein